MKTLACLLGSMMALSGMAVGFSSIPPVFSHPKRHKKPPVVEKAAVVDSDPNPEPPVAVLADADSITKAVKSALDANAVKVEKKIIKAINVSVGDDPAPSPAPLPPPPNPTPPPPPPPPVVDTTPILSLPDTVLAQVGMPTKVKATTNGVMVRWFAKDDGLALIDGELLKDSTITQVWANSPGNYRLMAYTSLNDVLTDPVMCMIVVHGPQPPPVPVPPVPVPPVPVPPVPVPPVPVPPPVTQATALWIVTVDDITKRDSATATVLTDMNLWNSVAQAGHQSKRLNSTVPEAQKFKQQIQANGGIPVIVIMDANKVEHNWLNLDPMDTKLPTTSQGVKNLINKYTSQKVQ